MKATPRRELPSFFRRLRLLAEVERLHDRAVALDVDLLEILEQLAALAHQTQQRPLRPEVVLVALEVFSKVADTVRKQRDLALGEPVSVLDLPYWPKISCFFSAVK